MYEEHQVLETFVVHNMRFMREQQRRRKMFVISWEIEPYVWCLSVKAITLCNGVYVLLYEKVFVEQKINFIGVVNKVCR